MIERERDRQIDRDWESVCEREREHRQNKEGKAAQWEKKRGRERRMDRS